LASVALVTLSGLLAAAGSQYDPTLQFQNRGDRYEGIRSVPVGGLDVELLSARVDDPKRSDAPWGEQVAIRFYLPAADAVHITVRQLRSGATNYWLDRVQRTWKEGSVNEYAWATAPVLRRLVDVRFEDLGAVIRVGRDDPLARTQRVLPVVFFQQQAVDVARAYRFALKTNGRARVSVAVYAGNTEIYRRPDNWEEAGSPFTIFRRADSVAEGWYRLVVSGHFANNAPLNKEIVFYHRPSLVVIAGSGG
jgi:hypothetical protein